MHKTGKEEVENMKKRRRGAMEVFSSEAFMDRTNVEIEAELGSKDYPCLYTTASHKFENAKG